MIVCHEPTLDYMIMRMCIVIVVWWLDRVPRFNAYIGLGVTFLYTNLDRVPRSGAYIGSGVTFRHTNWDWVAYSSILTVWVWVPWEDHELGFMRGPLNLVVYLLVMIIFISSNDWCWKFLYCSKLIPNVYIYSVHVMFTLLWFLYMLCLLG